MVKIDALETNADGTIIHNIMALKGEQIKNED
jgi:hypothetical protein